MPKTEIVVGPSHETKCPYFVRKATPIEVVTIEERFDFQIEENGKIGRVSLGEFDLVKEVNSHNGEVGLINCLKLAQARGIDSSTFAKTEPGLMVDLSDIETVDDLIRRQQENELKLKEIADKCGMTVEQVINLVSTGRASEIQPKVDEPVSTEGGNQ